MRLVERGDPAFEDAAYGRIFNARKPLDSPAAVLLAESEADVVAGVRLARERGWGVTVRSGGHSWAGWAVPTTNAATPVRGRIQRDMIMTAARRE